MEDLEKILGKLTARVEVVPGQIEDTSTPPMSIVVLALSYDEARALSSLIVREISYSGKLKHRSGPAFAYDSLLRRVLKRLSLVTGLQWIIPRRGPAVRMYKSRD